MVEEVRPSVPGAARGGLHRRSRLGGSGGGRTTRSSGDAVEAASAALCLRRPHQHPVHVGNHGLPQGGHPLPSQHPQQRLLRRRAPRLHRSRPGVPARALLSLLRHGHGQSRVHARTARPSSSRRRCSTRPPPWRRSRQERCTSLYGVPTMFIAELAVDGLRRLRPDLAAHRDHGRVALPGRGHEAGHHRDAHGGRGHRLRHDRDVAGVDPDPRRRRPRAAHRHGGPGHAPRGGKSRRPGERPGGPARHAGRAVHPGLLGDARLLGGARQDRRGDRRGPMDAHRGPGGHAARTGTSTSSGASRTWSSGAARTSTPARSRSSSTATPTSRTWRSSACPTTATARS